MCNSLIWEFIVYEFKLGHHAMEATKNVCGAKGEGTFDHRTVTRWFKNLDNQAKLDKPKSMDYKAVLKAIEVNPVWFITFTTSAKASEVAKLYFTLQKYC